MYYNNEQILTEAVFINGKEKVKPIEEIIQKIKDELDTQLNLQKENKDTSFDPKKFWKNELFKEFEDKVMNTFGFRHVSINPFIEKYNSKTDSFESRILNCQVGFRDRFHIEGVLTERGFYDKTHSIDMEIWASLGLLKSLTAEEILAVFLHEFGHTIDPALVDINYTGINILSKYITNRSKCINKNEERFIMKLKNKLKQKIKYSNDDKFPIIIPILSFDLSIFGSKESMMKKKLKKIKRILENDNTKNNLFNKDNYAEAFADNFARMYGYGHILMSAVKKLSNDNYNYIVSRYKREKTRQKIILQLTIGMIEDDHKTDIHRIRSIIKEYKKDINDPGIPSSTKTQLKEDLAELEAILDQYLNHKDEFQKRINNLINDELLKLEEKDNENNKKEY